MRRKPWAVTACALSIALIAPVGARADVLTEYQRLAERRLRPAPLVPIAVPSSVGPIDRTVEVSGGRGKNGYLIRFVHRVPGGLPDAIIALERGPFRSMKAALGEARRLGFSKRATRIRGHSGYLLRRHGQRSLTWVEDGLVFSIATGTTKKVSLKHLRATAASLDHLEREYIGSSYDSNTDANYGAVMVTTEHTVTGTVEWSPACVLPDGSPGVARSGHADVTLLPRRANAFSFDIARYLVGSDPWSGSVSGTIAPNAVALQLQATGSFDGSTCDSGPVSLALDKRAL
jgi:hypothetical protein